MGKRAITVVPLLALLLVLSVGTAARADGIYHSQHYPLTAIGSAPLRSGFVENIHANGPNVYAHEIYVLNGAGVGVSYQVVLSIWTSNTSCSGAPSLQLPTAVLSTNAGGAGLAQVVFTPAQADGLRGLAVSARWTLFDGSSPAYQTGCEVVTLD
jgi:hypothetical protein